MLTVKRTAIWYALRDITIEKPIILPYSDEELHELFFDQKEDQRGNIYYELNDIMYKVINKVDCRNLSFENVKMSGLRLDKAWNIRFNPQYIYNKDLTSTLLGPNVEIIGNDNLNQKDLFEGVSIRGTNFNYCKNVRINPQTIREKDFAHCCLAGVDFTNFSFDGAQLWETSFEGSIGVAINPNKVINFDQINSLECVMLTDLPEQDRYFKANRAKNYYDLMATLGQIQSKFKELIKDQLPEEKKEEPAPQPIDPPKQKRKWFGN